jgi:hypothetical protein
MADWEAAHLLDGAVQLDDTHTGGEHSGGKAGQGSEHQVPFVAARSLDAIGGPTHLKLDVVRGFTSQSTGKWGKPRLALGCVVLNDGLGWFATVTDAGCIYLRRVVGNLKTTLSDAFYALKYRKHGQVYLTAFAYRINRRFDLRGLVATLIADVARSKPVPDRVVGPGHAEAAL